MLFQVVLAPNSASSRIFWVLWVLELQASQCVASEGSLVCAWCLTPPLGTGSPQEQRQLKIRWLYWLSERYVSILHHISLNCLREKCVIWAYLRLCTDCAPTVFVLFDAFCMFCSFSLSELSGLTSSPVDSWTLLNLPLCRYPSYPSYPSYPWVLRPRDQKACGGLHTNGDVLATSPRRSKTFCFGAKFIEIFMSKNES